MLSPQEYERNLQEYQRAVQLVPQLETRIATLEGLLTEAQATITRQESSEAALQAERDAAVARLGAILVGLGTAATILVDLHKGHLPLLNAEVEKAIEEARKNAVQAGLDSSGKTDKENSLPKSDSSVTLVSLPANAGPHPHTGGPTPAPGAELREVA
jgi:hypothetical protein